LSSIVLTAFAVAESRELLSGFAARVVAALEGFQNLAFGEQVRAVLLLYLPIERRGNAV
jgi:hypothetical protein